MSTAKHRMRDKKMRNQPINVTYSSQGSSHWRNGGDTPTGRGYDLSPHPRGQGSSHSGHAQRGGWVRGHQREGHGGYPQALPTHITASAFAKARAAEVNAMLTAVTKTTGSSHVFGALPKHMRRRAMSHNTKRLPCRLRDTANNMLEKSQKAGQKVKKEQSKSKSRKARRRHGNMLLEFNRRQRKNLWLETHIWHAKRFHMVRRWGYCLGDRPTYKCYRACYRAMSSHCLIQDMSYYCCVELQGPEEQLLATLSKLTSKEAGPTFAAAMCVSGRRQGSVVVYRAGLYPLQPLGPVTFLWRPRTQGRGGQEDQGRGGQEDQGRGGQEDRGDQGGQGSTHRQLWIWAHPTMKTDLLPELQAVCQCSEAVLPPAPVELPVPQPAPTPTLAPGPGACPEAVQASASGSKRKWSSREPEAAGPPAKKLVGYSTISATTPVTWRSSTTGIVISDLTMEMVRYRLIGPLSHSVLTETLDPATHCDATGKSRPSPFWWPDHCRDDCNMSLHQQQAGVFNMLKGVYSTAEVPAGSVLGLTVDDPRLTLPNKRGKAVSDFRKAQGVNEKRRRELMLKGIPEPLSQSSLWDRSVRDNVTHNKMTDQEVNRLRNDVLVPGSRLPTPLQGRVPVLLVQQSGKSQGTEMGSWGTGWDLLLPKAWGMAFWVPLVYRGVRIGGLRMSLKHAQNKGEPHFPHDYPDCPAGARFQEEQEAELLAKFRRRPPAKRTNYIKHGCLAPFRCPWQQLVEEWQLIVKEGGGEEGVATMEQEVTTPQRNFTVLRNRKSLRQLSAWCRPTSSKCQRARNLGSTPPLNRNVAAALLSAHGGSSLVWTRLSLVTKGQPEQHALVCVPTAEDLQLVRKEPGCTGPQEPLHTDHFKSRVKRPRKKDHNKPGTSSSAKPENKQSDPASTSVPSVKPGADPSSSSSLTNPSSSSTSVPSVKPGADPSSSSSLTNPSSSCTSGLTLGLWPEPLPSVTSHCSRVTLGWVTQGDFSLSAGCGEALGLLSVTGLLHTLLRQPDSQRGLVLLRNPGSLQYRFAKINIEV
ncbi:ribonucleases P/MRP protein subunit POP1-like isoform X1 [Salvelinus fontinalis]|uniref:ribonucleases P/MRP protein subunit POP1-like isoform X1 n=1 Tax=Salvelinus fontinalis TaxID=8038 RepID=UPI00248518AA|nr:ribonucleases P/MRP protein subunit POP1-like isoform X1 [Salvelinus fontinalis]XP_055766840.1 ribonucleases P/MRP protein subunit POP1-like isoform X1 [Salvelinus fontinalis]